MAVKMDKPRMGMGKQLDRNCGCDIVITNDLRSSTPKSLSVKGSGLLPGIGPWVGTLNHALASFYVQGQERLYTTHVNPPHPPPPSFAHCVCNNTRGQIVLREFGVKRK